MNIGATGRGLAPERMKFETREMLEEEAMALYSKLCKAALEQIPGL